MLRTNNISKSYQEYQVLKNFNLHIKAHERVAMMGASGCGKTSLINILAGLDHEFKGEVIRNTDKISVVFQDAGLFSYKTVKENIAYALKGKITDPRSYQHWLKVCDLQEVEHHYPFQLSRGMKQRVAIIRSFISAPELIFLDEPFSGQDQPMAMKIINHILECYSNTAMLVTSHTAIPDNFCHKTFTLK